MPNRNQIIAITVLGIVALMLGCKPDATGIGEVAGDPTIEPKPNPVEPKPDPVEPKPDPVEPKPNPVKPNPNPVKPNPNPVKPRTISRKDIVGTYERKSGANTLRHVFLDNGIMEIYYNGKREGVGGPKWSLVENEIHIEYANVIEIYRIYPDNSITWIATIIGGKRTDVTKVQQQTNTWKKIK